jgi:adenylylsulfate kinase
MKSRCIVLLTGKPAAGKSTLARALADHYNSTDHAFSGTPWRIVDADEIRKNFWPHLGHSTDDRKANLAGLVHVTRGVLAAGNNVLLCCVSPFAKTRQWMLDELSYIAVGRHHAFTPYAFTLWIDAPYETLRQRDPKGLYRLQAEGKLEGLTGVDAVYEPPVESDEPFLLVRTNDRSVDACVNLCSSYLSKQIYIRQASAALSSCLTENAHGNTAKD